MPVDLSRTLVVGISSTALFDLSEVDQHFREAEAADREQAIREYRELMRAKEDEPLQPGVGMPVVKALLRLNQYQQPEEPPIVEVLVMSKNSPETGARVLKCVRKAGLEITRSAFTGGEPLASRLDAFSVDLFLTTDPKDAQAAIDTTACAAAVLRPGVVPDYGDDNQVRIAFDADAVLFADSSEVRYQTKGMKAFHDYESAHENEPLEDGPYANLLRKLSKLQDRLPMTVEYSPVRIMIVTARNAPSELRVINTLREWNVYVDEAYFLGGLEKAPLLEKLRPHIFFDDQDRHLDAASRVVPSGKVPYLSTSPLAKPAPDEAAEPSVTETPTP